MQPRNGVPCRPFAGDPHDCQLLEVLLPILESLATASDIRPLLCDKFQMTSWFGSRGYCLVESAEARP
jgi:carboxy-terminal domain RNA polymerase II polypeptide A small phosphatase